MTKETKVCPECGGRGVIDVDPKLEYDILLFRAWVMTLAVLTAGYFLVVDYIQYRRYGIAALFIITISALFSIRAWRDVRRAKR